MGARAVVGLIIVFAIEHGVAQGPVFEVASVKENTSGDGAVRMQRPPGGRLVLSNMPLREVIRLAYGVQDFQLVEGGHRWINNTRFDVNAKADRELPVSLPGGPPGIDMMMLRTLLAERFKLVTHTETREMPIYTMVLVRPDGTPGPQLRRSAADCDALLDAFARTGAPPLLDGRLACAFQGSPQGWSIVGFPISQLARALSGEVQRFVIDRTGLVGGYDLNLKFIRDQPGSPRPASVDPDVPGLFTALQEQLGLKLESTRGPVEVLMIDSVEFPTPD